MWFAHVTVANVVVKSEKFLMVKEVKAGRMVINQPAGHLENGETLIQALLRETLEETGWEVKPLAALGISLFKAENGETYVRHTFLSEALGKREGASLDPDIAEACWMSMSEIQQQKHNLRSPLVLNDIKRYQSGARFPLDELYFDAL